MVSVKIDAPASPVANTYFLVQDTSLALPVGYLLASVARSLELSHQNNVSFHVEGHLFSVLMGVVDDDVPLATGPKKILPKTSVRLEAERGPCKSD